MKSLNKVLLIGNLGQDPVLEYTPNGTAVTKLSIATAESQKNKSGEWEERTEWHRVVLFGKQAESASQYLRKGSKVFIEGRLKTRSWEDQNGQKKYATDIISNDVVFLDSKQDGSRREPANGKPQPQSKASEDYSDDDLPF